MKTYLGFKQGKLLIVITVVSEFNLDSISDIDYWVDEPQDLQNQLKEWKEKHS